MQGVLIIQMTQHAPIFLLGTCNSSHQCDVWTRVNVTYRTHIIKRFSVK